MNVTRFLVHPVAKHERSRIILLLFIAASVVVFGYLWWTFLSAIKATQVDIQRIPSVPSIPLAVFLSPWFHFFLTFGCAVVAASVTSFRTVGPIKRIEQWMLDWERGHDLGLLRVRKGDWYQELVEMINALYLRSKTERKRK